MASSINTDWINKKKASQYLASKIANAARCFRRYSINSWKTISFPCWPLHVNRSVRKMWNEWHQRNSQNDLRTDEEEQRKKQQSRTESTFAHADNVRIVILSFQQLDFWINYNEVMRVIPRPFWILHSTRNCVLCFHTKCQSPWILIRMAIFISLGLCCVRIFWSKWMRLAIYWINTNSLFTFSKVLRIYGGKT